MNKKILAVMAAFLMCAGLSACSEAPAENESSEAEKTIAAADPVFPDEETTPDETTTEEETTSAEVNIIEKSSDDGLLTTTSNLVPLDDEYGFYLELDLSKEKLDEDTTVSLYDAKGQKVAEMMDDGDMDESGDRTADDGIYSCFFKPESDECETYEVTAEYGDKTSNMVRLRTYTDDIPEELSEDFNGVMEEFSKISEKYSNTLGEYSSENAVKATKEATALAEKLYADGRIVSYRSGDGNVVIKHLCGTTYIFSTETMK